MTLAWWLLSCIRKQQFEFLNVEEEKSERNEEERTNDGEEKEVANACNRYENHNSNNNNENNTNLRYVTVMRRMRHGPFSIYICVYEMKMGDIVMVAM